MKPANEYEFVVTTDGAAQAHALGRGHAIRTALRVTPNGSAGVLASSSSETTVAMQGRLKNRFRLTNASDPKWKRAGSTSVPRRTKDLVPMELRSANYVPLTRSSAYSREVSGTRIVQRFGNNAVDPFCSLPITTTSGTDGLLRYFFLDLVDLYGQRRWFELCMIEPALFNATLAFTAILWLNVNPALTPSLIKEGMFRKGETIKAANSLVRKAEVSDTLIAAVAKLSQLASTAGAPMTVNIRLMCLQKGAEGLFEEAAIHLRGLRDLINTRGGMQELKGSISVVRAVSWWENPCPLMYMYSFSLQGQSARGSNIGTETLLPLIHGMEDITIPQPILAAASLQSLSGLQSTRLNHAGVQQVISCLRLVMHGREEGTVSAGDVATLLNIADVRILESIENQGNGAEERLCQTMLLAAHVFSHIALRRWPRSGPVAHVLLLRLKDALEHLVVSTWTKHLPWLLWALLVGAVAGLSDSNIYVWFSSKAYVVAKLLGADSADAVRDILSGIIWDDPFENKSLRRWWTDSRPVTRTAILRCANCN